MLSSIAKASMLENAESPDPAVSSMSMCFCGIVSLCSVNVVCPCGCCVCLYDVLISMTEEVVEIGTEGELWCVVGLLNLLECTMCSVVWLFCGFLPDATGWKYSTESVAEWQGCGCKLCKCFVTAYANVNAHVNAAVDSVDVDVTKVAYALWLSWCWASASHGLLMHGQWMYFSILSHFLSPLCCSCWMWQSMSAQILYSFVMLLVVLDAAVRGASLIHFYSSSLLVCATSIGCYSSKFAPILGRHADASVILELLCLLV